MDLTEITHPSAIQSMTHEELAQVAQDIRRFLIEQLSVTGGHIGPNLGVVELTLMLHKLFDSPNDKFIWDVGHQAYVHKILTGRADQFDTIRQYKGMSGFPKRSESEHDVWETGHSSTSLSAAMGMAAARDILGEPHHIIPIIGDGALTGGMALEALNHIGHEQTNMIVILNDNEMSIAPNVGAMHAMLGKLRTAGKYKTAKDELEYILKKVPAIGGTLASAAEKVKDSLKYMLVSGVFFAELGFTYLGPVDGHDFVDLERTLTYAKKVEGPVLVHVITKKGKGYQPAENDKVGTWHGTGPYKIETGDFVKAPVKGPAWSALIADTVERIAAVDQRVVAITPAMPVGSKLEKFAKRFQNRFYDVGIAEQHAATMAGGLAAVGMKPFLAIYSTFLQRAYDQVLHDITRQKLNVFIGIDRAGLVGADGETHHGVFDIAFLRHLPNLVIMHPKDENEGQHMVKTALDYDDGPIALRYPRGNGSGVPMDEELHTIPIGTWDVLEKGTDVTILTFGTMIPVALEASRLAFEARGLSVEVVNARFIKPMDEHMLAAIRDDGKIVITLEEGVVAGGFGSGVQEWYIDRAETSSDVPPMKSLGIPDEYIEHGSVDQLLEEIGLTAQHVAQVAIDMWDRDDE